MGDDAFAQMTPTYEFRDGVLYETTWTQVPGGNPFSTEKRIGLRDATSGMIQLDEMPSNYLRDWFQEQGGPSIMVQGQQHNLINNQYAAVNAEGVPVQQAALQATAAKRAGILGSMQEGYREAMGTLRGAGQREAADIRETSMRTAARGQQELVTRGFAGTTILPTMRAGAARQKTAALGRLGERLRREKLGLMTGLRSEMFGFRERGVLTPGQTMQWSAALGASGQA